LRLRSHRSNNFAHVSSAAMRVRNRLEHVGHVGLGQRRLQIGNDVGRNRRVHFGESDVNLALDRTKMPMRRVRLVGDHVHAIQRRGRLHPREPRRHVQGERPAHAVTDASNRTRLHLVLRVQEREHAGGIVVDAVVGQALHGAANHDGHCVVPPRNVEADRTQPVVQVGQQAEIPMPGDAPRLVAQLVAESRRVHVQDDGGKGAGHVRTHGEAGLAPVLGDDGNFSFNHRIALSGAVADKSSLTVRRATRAPRSAALH
jgi:hypothetical protein